MRRDAGAGQPTKELASTVGCIRGQAARLEPYARLGPLEFELPSTGTSALSVLLERARKKTMRLWAEQSPFDLKDALKQRGYRWSDGSDGRPRSWYIDVDENKLDDEIAFLKNEIYLRDAEPRFQPLTAFDRFSVRA